jgi:cobalt/nickel transport system permease protein
MAAPAEAFAEGASPLHRLDPRAKLAGAGALALALATARTPATAAAGLALGLVLLLLARLPLRAVLRRLLVVNGFTLFLAVLLPLTYDAGPYLSFSFLEVSQPGLRLAGLIALKTNAILCAVLALLSTSRVPELGRALRWWRVPGKLCWLLLFSYRYLFLIHEEYARLRRAAAMRCFVPRTGLHTYATYGNLLGMTLVRSWNRSRRVGQAMVLRGFAGEFRSLGEPAARPADLLAGAALCGLAIFLFLADHRPSF